MREDVNAFGGSALYSPPNCGDIARELISSPLKNCTIIHCTLSRNTNKKKSVSFSHV